MRTVTYGAACSLDGFIADATGGVDWLHFSKDVQAHMAAYWPTAEEGGVTDFKVGNWQGLFAPAGTPKPIVDKITRTVVEVLFRTH